MGQFEIHSNETNIDITCTLPKVSKLEEEYESFQMEILEENEILLLAGKHHQGGLPGGGGIPV